MSNTPTHDSDVTATPSDAHLLNIQTNDYSTGFTCTSVDARHMSFMRFDREGRHHTAIGLHNVTDFKVDYESGLFGPTITMLVGGESVTINLYNADPEA